MTKANIRVNEEKFHVNMDGMDGNIVKEVLQNYIKEAKKKLKNPKDIALFVRLTFFVFTKN